MKRKFRGETVRFGLELHKVSGEKIEWIFAGKSLILESLEAADANPLGRWATPGKSPLASFTPGYSVTKEQSSYDQIVGSDQ
jgi:hypothetical protein